MVLPLIAGLESKLLSSGKTEDKELSVSKKKIKTEKFFDKKGGGGALAKTEKTNIKIKPTGALVKYRPPEKSKDKITDLSPEEKKKSTGDELQSIIDEVKKLRSGLVQVRGLLAERKNSDLQSLVESRKALQIRKAKRREDELEKKKPKQMGGGVNLPKPKLSFFDTIKNFFMNILIGSLLNFLLANKNTIFNAFNTISNGFNNVFNVMRYAIVSLTTTMPKLVKSVANFGKQVFGGPAKMTGNLLKSLGMSIKNLLVKTGKTLGGFVSNQFKNLRNVAGGAGTTRATGVQQRRGPTTARPKPTAQKGLRQLPKPGTPKILSSTTLQNAQKKLLKPDGVKHFKKVSGVFKKIPFIGALVGLGIDLAMGERLDNAVAGAAGASLGAAIGGAIGSAVLPIPFVGTFLGGTVGAAVGDWAGKEIYKKLNGQITQINPEPEPPTNNNQQPPPPPGTQPLPQGYQGTGAPGQLFTSNAQTTWYNPALGGTNSGTGQANPNAPTSTGQPYQASAFTAAAFPPMLRALPLSMTTRSAYNPSGRTLARGQAFLALVTNKRTGKSAIVKINDVGSGVGDPNKWLDFSVATKNYLGHGAGPYEIRMAPAGSRPGPVGQQTAAQIQALGRNAAANAASSYTVGGITYSMATGRPVSLPALPPTNTLPGKQHYGAPRERGRKHAGVDFDIRGNQKFYSRIGGVVVSNPFRYGDDGLAIDIYNAQLGVYERIAEARTVLVKKGDIVQPGQAVVQGESATGVIHYEIRKKIYGGIENTLNPISFLSGVSPTTIAQQATQKPSQQISQGLSQQASYEQTGGITVVPMPILSGNTVGERLMGGGRGGMMPIGASGKDLLNSYYRAQLMGFLYKQG